MSADNFVSFSQGILIRCLMICYEQMIKGPLIFLSGYIHKLLSGDEIEISQDIKYNMVKSEHL